MQYNDIAEKGFNSEHNLNGGGEKKRWAQKWHVDSHHLWHYNFEYPNVAKPKIK